VPWTGIQRSTKAKAGATVTALCLDDVTLELWMTDGHGTVYSTSTDISMSWQNMWTAIAAVQKPQGGAPITALWNDPDRIDIFMTDGEGNVQHSWLPVE